MHLEKAVDQRKKQHGGSGRGQGRKLGPWGKRRLLSIKCTPAEFARIKKFLGVRKRAEALLEVIENNER